MFKCLLIDAGNTCVKWAVSHAGELTSARSACYSQDLPAIDGTDLFELSQSVDQVLMVSVADAIREQFLIEGLKEPSSVPLKMLSVQSQAHGVTVCYEDAGSLGGDRWAAMIAARNLEHGAVGIIDSGTATTFDLLAADGQHLGGLIIPGLDLMTSSLLEGTARIDGNGNNSELGLLACDTLSAVSTGGLQATLGFIERLQREVANVSGTKPTFFLCGGNAKYLLPFLPGDIRHEPDLVLKGLNIIAMDYT